MKNISTLIQNKTDLRALVQEARQTDAVALDTEFVWERTYYPQLGLIQMALSDEDCFLIDPCSIEDLSPLGELLADRSIIKILHDAPQDLIILRRATGATPQNIFDTRLAAGFSDMPATLSLSNLVKELLDITLEKTETRTNWLQRPLTPEQISYALNDVRYLRAVRILLLTRIIGPKIKSWLHEELNLLNNPANYSGPDADMRFSKIRGSNSLDRQSLAILKNLTIWREGMAKKANRPRGHIVKDPILLEIAKHKLHSPEKILASTSLSSKAMKKYGKNLAAIAQRTIGRPEKTYPPLSPSPYLNSSQKGSLKRLNGLIALKCKLLGIDPSLVGNSSELKMLITMLNSSKPRDTMQLRQTEGWRKSLLEDFFQQNR
ncbi:MAG: HRDC domain-containing protein [Deltaproteobacteria bacterium]|nr:HRDC domain-containing protein [Deltaproteobacteria bacterium]